ncbi:profilin [Cylindrobasidium torrendii FP15055 ss-10]|uniref:Profilin n=1 Tax=Cylindrobasidium torrendii FP15055 ss-10 TaxID=1314674 RepID=A0A0D7B5E8_9AGAR|nr:profilin [Cylindrobasidium torrendii FP15055 ss-10]
MSWQAYVDTNLVGSGKIKHAAILGLQGGVWATSPGFTIEQAEQTAILGSFSNPASVQESGIRTAGAKYFTLQANERSVYGKKGGDGIILVKTTQAVLVAVYTAPTQAPEATPVVEGLADYLISVGY